MAQEISWGKEAGRLLHQRWRHHRRVLKGGRATWLAAYLRLTGRLFPPEATAPGFRIGLAAGGILA